MADTERSNDQQSIAQAQSVSVEQLSPRIQVINFAVEIPPSALQAFDEPMPRLPVPLGDLGVVGTITVLRKSAMIWLGWGQIRKTDHTPSLTQQQEARGIPTMGQMVVAMPRTKYKGAFSGDAASSTSQLVGGDEDDQLIGSSMASRLSQRLGYPVICSCCLSSQGGQVDTALSGMDRSSIAQRAAALAERKVAQLLTQLNASQS